MISAKLFADCRTNGIAFLLFIVAFVHVAFRTARYSDRDSTVAISNIQASSEKESSLPKVHDSNFVSLCPVNFDSRRLGNQLFNFAAMMYIAQLTGRRIVMPRRHGSAWIDRWFQVPNVEFVDNIVPQLCPCRNVTERRPLAFERSLRRAVLETNDTKTLLTCGWFQSWRYVAGTDSGRELRARLQWKPEITRAVHRFFAERRPLSWNSTTSYKRIGIHVRVGDLLDRQKLAFGYRIPGRSYFRRAISYLLSNRSKDETRVQLVVTSDDVGWTQTHLKLDQIVARYGNTVDLIYSDSTAAATADSQAGFDLALLSACDDVIMSTGTYGWWAAWLAAGKTVYYSRWPRRASPLAVAFDKHDFFPPGWIAL